MQHGFWSTAKRARSAGMVCLERAFEVAVRTMGTEHRVVFSFNSPVVKTATFKIIR